MTKMGSWRSEGDVALREALQGPRCHKRRFLLDSEAAEREGREPELFICPICGAECSDLVVPRGGEDESAVKRAQEEFQGWQPNDGLCEGCLERYRMESTG